MDKMPTASYRHHIYQGQISEEQALDLLGILPEDLEPVKVSVHKLT
jgi:hypothetical protein